MDCVICNNLLIEGDTVTVKKRGLATLIKFSHLRNDGLSFLFESVDEIRLHTTCRKKYTKENVKGVYKPVQFEGFHPNNDDGAIAGPSGTHTPEFPFTEKCFFCTQDLSDESIGKENKKPVERRCVTYRVSKETTTETILEALRHNEQSSTSQVILQRIENVNLVRAQARYHKQCYIGIMLPKQNLKRGRPECSDVTTAMQIIYDYIDENEDSQFSIKELRNLLTDYKPDDRTILKKLCEKYHGKIYVAHPPGQSTIVTFKDSIDNILFDNWYSQKSNNESEERLRIVKKAADIIREDIRTKTYDKSSYPSPSDFLKSAEKDIPETLLTFLKTLAGCRATDPAKRKMIAIAHAILQVLRPKKFLSCILMALSITLKKNYGSKNLINTLNALGFCTSYKETNIFEVSAINYDDSVYNKSDFVQFVFDNADANTNTIDGHNTFHAMGGIECKTPIPKTMLDQPIPRVEQVPNSEVLGSFGNVPLQHYNKQKCGLKEIVVKNIVANCKTVSPTRGDMLWLYGKHKNMPDIGGWNGFMQQLTEKEPFEVTHIKTLPFVNSPPSNHDTINTVLTMACQRTAENNQKITFVTFDQPLYAKAREIAASAAETEAPLLKNVVIRIGGFHLLMSFMGGIGYIMAGSGLKELWSTIYAPNTVNHMLSGHAYSRALRANLLTYLVLSGYVFKEINIDDNDASELEDIFDHLNSGTNVENTSQEAIDAIKEKFHNALRQIELRSPTAKLWVQYFKMVCLIKNFIEAERSGNWQMHLETVKQMLPIFVASGHFNYAKSLRIYIQDMEQLEKNMPKEEYEKFTSGAFTIRRTNKFWTGTWTDMVIEQSLMRTMKCRGGLTHGRGITDSVLAKWVLSMPVVQKVETCLESLCDFDSSIDSTHKDSTPARIIRDDSDVLKLTDWFEEHAPFRVHSENDIVSLSTGLKGDTKTINCHQAFEIGENILSSKVGMPFSDLSYSRKERVVPISNLNVVKDHDQTQDTPIDPLTIFQRISFLKKGEEEMREYLTHELAPYPLSLFDETGMRKTKKSALFELFNPVDISFTGRRLHYVLDGGHLLHRVVWNKGQTYEEICITIKDYVMRHYGNGNEVSVVFDGYDDQTLLTCTKTAERMKRSGHKITADVLFEPKMQMTTSQTEFLSSNKNKSRFIALLSKYMRESGINVTQCEADADTQIVMEALAQSSKNDCVVIVGDDVDLLIILSGLTKEANVFIAKPAKGNMEAKIYNANCMKYNDLKSHLLLMHAFSGCDTTSALFNVGKKKIFEVVNKNEYLRNDLLPFYDKQSSQNAIALAGERLFLALYGGDPKGDLNDLRYQKFARSLTKSKINLANLPPSKGAAKQHSLRVYHQIQLWMGNHLDARQYGWMERNNVLTPVTSTMKPAPDNVLKMIFCRCKTNCGSQCGCRKSGLKCTDVCENCKGQSCTNAQTYIIEPDEIDDLSDDQVNQSTNTDLQQSKRPRI